MTIDEAIYLEDALDMQSARHDQRAVRRMRGGMRQGPQRAGLRWTLWRSLPRWGRAERL